MWAKQNKTWCSKDNITVLDDDDDGGANYDFRDDDNDMATEVQTNYVHSQNFLFVATITKNTTDMPKC